MSPCSLSLSLCRPKIDHFFFSICCVCVCVACQQTLRVRPASLMAMLRDTGKGNMISVAMLDMIEWVPYDEPNNIKKAIRILLFLTAKGKRRMGYGRYTVACIKVFLFFLIYLIREGGRRRGMEK